MDAKAQSLVGGALFISCGRGLASNVNRHHELIQVRLINETRTVRVKLSSARHSTADGIILHHLHCMFRSMHTHTL